MVGSPPSRSELAKRYTFELATTSDDQGLRRLLRTTPIQGDISITMEREPDYFAAPGLMGPLHQTLIARDTDTNNIIASGSRSVRARYLNGDVRNIGYLGELRVDASYRGYFGFIRKGYDAMRRLHEDGAAPFYLTSIVSDNIRARRFLEKGVKGMPSYTPMGTLLTLVIPTRRSAFKRYSDCSTASPDSRKQIADCLHGYYQRYDWAPYWKPGEIGSETGTPGLSMEDFLVSKRGNEIAGCMALWNQQHFRQIVVRGYSPNLARWRPFLNVFSRLSGRIRLPSVGKPWSYAYISPMAVDEDNPDVFTRLLQSTLWRARIKGYDYVLLGLADRHPLLGVARSVARYRREYTSQLYLVSWDEPPIKTDVTQNAVPHPEAALL